MYIHMYSVGVLECWIPRYGTDYLFVYGGVLISTYQVLVKVACQPGKYSNDTGTNT